MLFELRSTHAQVLLEYFKRQWKDQEDEVEIVQAKPQVAQEVKSRMDSGMLETWAKNLEFKLGKSHQLTMEYTYFVLLIQFEGSMGQGPDHQVYTPLHRYFGWHVKTERPIPTLSKAFNNAP
jgi:hypothetical protein